MPESPFKAKNNPEAGREEGTISKFKRTVEDVLGLMDFEDLGGIIEEDREDYPTQEDGPDILRDVVFKKVQKRDGTFEYRSSSPDRKIIILQDGSPEPESRRYYKVRILEDTDPEASLRGKYIVELVAPEQRFERKERSATEKRELKAHVMRTTRLRDSAAFRTFAKVIRSNPDIYREVLLLAERKKEFEADTTTPEQMHRVLSGWFAGVAGSRRAFELLDVAIDRNVEDQSNHIRKLFETRELTYYPELLIGSGPISAVMEAERMAIDPEAKRLVIDKNKRIGGQFAQQQRSGWVLNNRTRRETMAQEPVPGTEGNLSSLGKCVVQVSDLTNESYVQENMLAAATRINHLLDSDILHRVEVMSVRVNEEGRQGRYEVRLRDPKTEANYFLTTDRIIDVGGVGKRKKIFEAGDITSQEVVDEEQKKYEETGDAGYLTYGQFMEKIGDSSNPFPLENFGDSVIILGSGDGAITCAEALLGYGMSMGKAKTQMKGHRPGKIFLVSPNVARTKQEYLKKARPRYAQIGTEFPTENSDRFHRIVPIRGGAELIRKVGNGFEITLDNGEVIAAPRVIETVGYDQSYDIYNGLYEERVSEPDRIEAAVESALRKPGSIIYYKNRSIISIEVIDYDTFQEEIQLKLTYEDDRPAEIRRASFQDLNVGSTKSDFFNPDTISEVIIKRVPQGEPGTEVVEGVVGQSRRDIIAKKIPGQEIYFAGVRSNIPISGSERLRIPALANIPENTASLFRYVPKVRALEAALRVKDERIKRQDNYERKESLLTQETEFFNSLNSVEFDPLLVERGRRLREERRRLLDNVDEETDEDRDTIVPNLKPPAVSRDLTEDKGMSVFSYGEAGDIKTVGKNLPEGATIDDFLKFSLGYRLARYDFPLDFREFKLVVTRQSTEKNSTQEFEILVKGAVSKWSKIIRNATRDMYFERIAYQLTKYSVTTFGVFEITVPIEGGKVNAGSISYRLPKNDTEAREMQALE